jgi:hypothetical protein
MRSPINNVMLVEKWNCGVEVCPKYLMGEFFLVNTKFIIQYFDLNLD